MGAAAGTVDGDLGRALEEFVDDVVMEFQLTSSRAADVGVLQNLCVRTLARWQQLESEVDGIDADKDDVAADVEVVDADKEDADKEDVTKRRRVTRKSKEAATRESRGSDSRAMGQRRVRARGSDAQEQGATTRKS